MDNEGIIRLAEFDQIVNNNKTSGRDWYYGLEGKWWWGMSESRARRYVVKLEEKIRKREEESRKKALRLQEKIRKREEEAREKATTLEAERASVNKIVLASTWNIRCGIATYTKYLLDSLNRIAPNSFMIDPITDGELRYKSKSKLTHLQHEFGILPDPPKKINSKLIITWHTVSKRTNDEIKKYESKYDVVAHIVHSEYMRHSIDSSKDVWAIPHGSLLIPQMRKEDAKRLLGINVNMPIGFVFGFQSSDKNYQRLIYAAKNTGIHLIISGAQHRFGHSSNIPNDSNVTFINRFMEENEINIYALASDLLLFDYVGKNHYSVSGALHRIIGAARPVICSDIKHFDDVEHRSDCLKFKDQEGLEKCIKRALENSEKFGLAAKNYAEKTSWEKIARKHIDIYGRYVDTNC